MNMSLRGWLAGLFCMAGVTGFLGEAQADELNQENNFIAVALEDNQQPLRNPGMGWTMHFYSNVTDNYGRNLAPSDTLEWFEGETTIYLRLPWCYIEPEEGRFEWSVVDTPAQRWIAAGKKVAFRFTTSENWIEYATPKWVEAAGAKFVRYSYAEGPKADGSTMDPVFDDPIFLEKLEAFLAAAGKRYNGNPDVAFIDVGTFGLWGEGHTVASQQLPMAENERLAKLHIDLHKKYFPDTQLVISDDVIGPETPGADFELMKYARSQHVSLRDDSILVQPGEKAWFHAELAQSFYPTMPVVLEHQHYGASLEVGAWNGDRLLESVEAYHASYLSIHWLPDVLYEAEYPTIQKVNMRLGYRFAFPAIRYPAEIRPGEAFSIRYQVGNAGVAPCYFDCFPAFTLKDKDGGIVAVLSDESLNLRDLQTGAADALPLREKTTEFTISAIAPKVKPGTYSLYLSAGRRDGTPLVELPYDETDGAKRYYLGEITVR